MIKPRFYLAGKIGKNDWRHTLVPGLRGHEWGDGLIETDDSIYVGPFFRSCDHGCFHGRASHGAYNEEGCFGNGDAPHSRQDIIRNNNAAMDSADLIFVYINALDCFGTLVEIGRATAQIFRARIVIAFATGIPVPDFWYSGLQVDATHENVCECRLPELIAAELNVVRMQNAIYAGGGR